MCRTIIRCLIGTTTRITFSVTDWSSRLCLGLNDTCFGRSKTYVSSAGQMTLLAELSDSTSGQMLARVADRREGNSMARMERVEPGDNEVAARDVAAAWAQILRKALDKAHAIGS